MLFDIISNLILPLNKFIPIIANTYTNVVNTIKNEIKTGKLLNKESTKIYRLFYLLSLVISLLLLSLSYIYF